MSWRVPEIGDKVVVVDVYESDKGVGVKKWHIAKVVKIMTYNGTKIIKCHNPIWDLHDGIRSMCVSQIKKIGRG